MINKEAALSKQRVTLSTKFDTDSEAIKSRERLQSCVKNMRAKRGLYI